MKAQGTLHLPEMLLDDTDLVVCNPAMTAERLGSIRDAADHPLTCLAYFNCADGPRPHWQSGYWGTLREILPAGPAVYEDAPSYLLTVDIVRKLMPIFERLIERVGFEGIYLDQCWGVVPDRYDSAWNRIHGRCDFLEARLFLTAALRARYPNLVLLANSGGYLVDPSVNGISLENPVATSDFAAFAEPERTGPPVNVAWVTGIATDESRAAAENAARQMGSVGLKMGVWG